MTRTTSTTRWLITVLLAAWMPLCACQATGLVRTGLGLAGIHAPGDRCCCCQDSENPSPVTASCRIGCCTMTLKVPPRPDRWEPSESAADAPTAHLAALAAACPAPAPTDARARRRGHSAPIPSADRSLLRQHCALII